MQPDPHSALVPSVSSSLVIVMPMIPTLVVVVSLVVVLSPSALVSRPLALAALPSSMVFGLLHHALVLLLLELSEVAYLMVVIQTYQVV